MEQTDRCQRGRGRGKQEKNQLGTQTIMWGRPGTVGAGWRKARGEENGDICNRVNNF